ncbi:hypothetical protein MJO29_004016 [Puccinia striiformis f. sp. tritici]|nr:hypothetical protein MJO29_004016 [Puccinia striiformis f. sp. tritici]
MNTILSCLITFGLLSMAQAGTTSVPLDNVHPTSYEFTIDSAHPQGVFAIKTDTASGILNCNTCKDFYTAKGCVKLTSRKADSGTPQTCTKGYVPLARKQSGKRGSSSVSFSNNASAYAIRSSLLCIPG